MQGKSENIFAFFLYFLISNFFFPFFSTKSYDLLAKDPDVDIVYIGTPHSFHFENAKLCLEHGKHVLIEKPICVNQKEAEALVKMAKAKGFN